MIILTGPIKTGKSTALQQWCKDKNDVGGFISLINEKDKREFYFPSLGLKIPFEVDQEYDGDTIEVGPFIFGEEHMETAALQAVEDLDDEDQQWIIVDELGILEIEDQGFHTLMEALISDAREAHKLILVIRDTLLDTLIEKYSLQNYRVILKEELPSI